MKLFVRWYSLAGALGAFLVMLYLGCINYVSFHEVGIARNAFSGAMWLEGPGLYWSAPWTTVARVDTRPVRLCTWGRSLTCRQVRFEPSGWSDFVRLEGHGYYWLSNRVSLNMGHADEYRGMRDVLYGYAFSNRAYSFLVVEGGT